MSDMGIFRVDLEIENPLRPAERAIVRSALVASGSELSWFPAELLESLGIERSEVRRFRQASGAVIERWVGHAFVYLAGAHTIDDVVFAQPGDLTLLGSRSLEGLNLTIDPILKRLVDAGPAPAAAASY